MRRSTLRTALSTVLVAVAALTATGCTVTGNGRIPVGAIDPLTGSGTAWVRSLPTPATGKLLTAEAGSAGLSMPWKFVKFGSTRRDIEVVYAKGDRYCVTPVGFRVEREGSNVLVEAISRSNGDSTCPSTLAVGLVWLRLPVAIQGVTKLEHAQVDPNWSAPGMLQ